MTTPNGAGTITIAIRRRPWWFWVLAGLWLLLEILFLQTALASAREGEQRAAAISWIAVAVLAAAGVLAWLRQGRSRRPVEAIRPL
jgi:di/tricarboxylate transporter